MNEIVRGVLALTLLYGCASPQPARSAQATATSTATPSPSSRAQAVRSPGSAGPGIGTTPTPTTTPSESTTRRTPAVTLQEARRTLDSHLAAWDVVRAVRADKWTLSLVRDGRRPIAVAQIHSTTKPARYTWGKRAVFVPRQSGTTFPQWFAATVERRSASGQNRTVVLVFVRMSEESPWQASAQSLLYPGKKPPKAAVDADGYATALELRDQTVAISPSLMGPLHATIAEEGTQSYASGLIAPGPHTTGLFEDIAATRAQAQTRDCMSYTSILALGTSYPIFALRAADGGALVFYTLVRTSTWSTSPGLKCARGRPVPIPSAARWLLTDAHIQVSQTRRIRETQQYVALVPPKASTAPAQIIAYEGAVTEASGS